MHAGAQVRLNIYSFKFSTIEVMGLGSEIIMNINNKDIKGFKTVWMQFDVDNTDRHQLFFKEHLVRKQDSKFPKGKTLFVLNIPPYVTEIALTNVFNKLCGNVISVTFMSSKGFKTAYIVFKKESALEKVLSLSNNTVIILSTPTNACDTGLAKWCKDYNNALCNESALKKEIEEYMSTYDEKIANEKASEEVSDMSNEWVTVTSKRKRGQFAPSRKESTINKIQLKEEERKRKKQLLNFYTFQIRESKKQNLADLRKKFELDKKRLQELKLKRTFKPF